MRNCKFFAYSWVKHLIVLSAFPIFLVGCGDIHLGTSTNDPTPSGTLVASGNFNSSQVSGDVAIYNSGTGYYTLRFVNYSGPGPNNVVANVTGNGSTVASIQMTVSSGTKNYTFSSGGTISFTAVTMHSTSTNSDYAIASLISH